MTPTFIRSSTSRALNRLSVFAKTHPLHVSLNYCIRVLLLTYSAGSRDVLPLRCRFKTLRNTLFAAAPLHAYSGPTLPTAVHASRHLSTMSGSDKAIFANGW